MIPVRLSILCPGGDDAVWKLDCELFVVREPLGAKEEDEPTGDGEQH